MAQGVQFERATAGRVIAATRAVETRNLSQPGRSTRNRYPRREGDAGEEVAFGQLIGVIPAGQNLADCVKVEIWDEETNWFIWDPAYLDEDDAPVPIGGTNRKRSDIRGSSDCAIAVEGVIRFVTVTEGEGEEAMTVRKPYFVVLWFDHAGMFGHDTDLTTTEIPRRIPGTDAYEVSEVCS